jgi:hypothetical protein
MSASLRSRPNLRTAAMARNNEKIRVLQLAVNHMQVGAAYAARGNFHQDLVLLGLSVGRSRMTGGVRGASSTIARMIVLI